MRQLLLAISLALAGCGSATFDNASAPDAASPATGTFAIDGVALPVTVLDRNEVRRRDGRRDATVTFSTDLSVAQLQDRMVHALRAKGATVVASTDGLIGTTRDGRRFGVRISAERGGVNYGTARILEKD